AREELESDNSKKQKLDENVEAEVDDEVEIKSIWRYSRRCSSMIKMLQNIDREDLETLWKLVKARHGSSRPEKAYERVLWGDLKVMFEPDIESEVWRNLQGHKVTIWKIFSSSGVHFVRFQNLHIFMLIEKKYPLTPATITTMLNKKLQADYWNKMIVGIKRLHDDLGVNAVKVRVTAAKHNLVLLVILVKNMLSISAAGIKVNAAGYNC
ncbi:hypothetical protein Tco_0517477, partial [Tanacetum coccineum]